MIPAVSQHIFCGSEDFSGVWLNAAVPSIAAPCWGEAAYAGNSALRETHVRLAQFIWGDMETMRPWKAFAAHRYTSLPRDSTAIESAS